MSHILTPPGFGRRPSLFAAALLTLALGFAVPALRAASAPGADLPWRTYEAEDMRTSGTVLGPVYAPYRVETESSGERCVSLSSAGQYLEFTVAAPANALVLRYSLPDAQKGGGTSSSLALFVNGKRLRTLALSSHFAWLYGNYPFSNDPAQGKPRNFYDELRLKDLVLAKGDVVRLVWEHRDVDHCIVDLVDLEQVAPPLPEPAGALSVRAFGAQGDGRVDDTAAFRSGLAAAAARHGILWLPPGTYKLSGDILVPSDVTIQGAGMWHTTLVGDEALYGHADRRVRFRLVGSRSHLADFAILGRLDYRNDSEPNDAIVGGGCADCSVERIWIEHTKTGVWVYNGARLRIEGCRFRDLLADGVNLCVGTYGTVIENCSARGTGDDCFAIWPAPFDQGFVGQIQHPGNNVIRHCTGQLPFLANGASIYGGQSNRIEDCAFTDITAGCGILLSTTFPTTDAARGIDNNFSGTTVVKNCDLLRCGGFDHDWAWRGSFQICMDRCDISGLRIFDVRIRDSLSYGLTVVGSGSAKGHGTLSDARLDRVEITGSGLGGAATQDLWIRPDAVGALTLSATTAARVQNDAPAFKLQRE